MTPKHPVSSLTQGQKYTQQGISLLGWLSFWAAVMGAKKSPIFYSFLSPQHQERLLFFQEKLRLYDNDVLLEKLQRETAERMCVLLESFKDLWQQAMPFSSKEASPNTYQLLWKQGSTKLLELFPSSVLSSSAPRVLMVPSLLNGGEIFNLKPDLSFASYLACNGIRPLVIEWGEPTAVERAYGFCDYVYHRLVPLLTFLDQEHHTNLFILGYCMGGLITLASLMHYQPTRLQGVGLMAVPWDFSAMPQLPAAFHPFVMKLLRHAKRQECSIPGSLIQGYFQLLAWPHIMQKLYSWNQATQAEKNDRLPLERWLNQGYGLTHKVAHECFHAWYQRNTPHHYGILGGTALDFGQFKFALWGAAPLEDKVVPPSSTLPLFNFFKDCNLIKPKMGHVGLFSSRQAQLLVWQPFVEWIKSINK